MSVPVEGFEGCDHETRTLDEGFSSGGRAVRFVECALCGQLVGVRPVRGVFEGAFREVRVPLRDRVFSLGPGWVRVLGYGFYWGPMIDGERRWLKWVTPRDAWG